MQCAKFMIPRKTLTAAITVFLGNKHRSHGGEGVWWSGFSSYVAYCDDGSDILYTDDDNLIAVLRELEKRYGY